MFGIGKLFERGKIFMHHIDGKVDVDLQNTDHSEMREGGGTCSACIWMTSMTSEAMHNCNTCVDHANFSGKKTKEPGIKKPRRKRG